MITEKKLNEIIKEEIAKSIAKKLHEEKHKVSEQTKKSTITTDYNDNDVQIEVEYYYDKYDKQYVVDSVKLTDSGEDITKKLSDKKLQDIIHDVSELEAEN